MKSKSKCKVYGYEGVTFYELYRGFLHATHIDKDFMVQFDNSYYGNFYIPKDFKAACEKFNIESASYNENDRFIFYKACRLPKRDFTGKIKFANSMADATIMVVPPFDYSTMMIEFNYCVFYSMEDNMMYFIDTDPYIPDFEYVPEIGETFMDYANKNMSIKTIAKSVENLWRRMICIHNTGVFKYWNNAEWKIDYVEGKIGKIIFEEDLKKLTSVGNDITPENLKGIYNCLDSLDNETVLYGINTLAALDYIRYPCIAAYLINKFHHRIMEACRSKHGSYRSKAITYMIKLYYDKVKTTFDNITDVEFELLRPYLTEEVKEEMNRGAAKVAIRYNFDVNYNVDLDMTIGNHYHDA